MGYTTVFQRYELKYLISKQQKEKILRGAAPYMKIDKYGRSTIRNIYFDTESYRLIRASIEKPIYKEKLRIRSYEKASSESTVFVELKKKFDSVVYKRRLPITEKQALRWIENGEYTAERTQIFEEIDYFLGFYKTLRPAVFLSYEREAYYMTDGSDFRLTFDDNILFRQTDISLESDIYGQSLLGEGQVLMEIKCSGGIPLFMSRLLSEEKIYKTAFSKYGAAYKNFIYPKLKERKDDGNL